MLLSVCILPLLTSYTHLHLNIQSVANHAIKQVTNAKYLGITITNNLSWSEHINNIVNKANSTKHFYK